MTKKDYILPFRVSSMILHIDENGQYDLKSRDSEGDIAVVFVTGEAVGSKEYDTADPIVRRIKGNAELYVSVHDDGTMYYVRRSSVDAVIETTGRVIIGIMVCRRLDTMNLDAETDSIRRSRLSLSALKNDMTLVNHLAATIFKKLRLPVLLVCLAVLLANFFIHSALTERLYEIRTVYVQKSLEATKHSAVTQAQKRLFAQYEAVPDADISGISDKIAFIVPEEIRLTALSFNEPEVIKSHSDRSGRTIVMIAGESVETEKVLYFVEMMRNNIPHTSLNVICMEKERKAELVKFEILLVQ